MTPQRKAQLLTQFSNLLDAIEAVEQGKQVYLLEDGERSTKGLLEFIGYEDINVRLDFKGRILTDHIYLDFKKTTGFTEYSFEIKEK